MDVDSEVEPTLQEMAKRIATMRADLLPMLQQLDEDAILSHYSVDEQARLYLSAAFTLALSLYSLDKITHRQASSGNAAAPRLTGAGTRHGNSNASLNPTTTDTQLVLKIERITEYIKKLQELATLERNKKLAATVSAADQETSSAEAPNTAVATEAKTNSKAVKRAREGEAPSAGKGTATSSESGSAGGPAKKAKAEASTGAVEAAEVAEDDQYGDAEMFSVVSRVAGETGTLVGRLLKQVMTAKKE